MIREEKLSYSELLNEKKGKLKTIEGKKVKDPCDACDRELYLDGDYTQRIGLIGEYDKVYGWMCPHCDSEFDMEGKITNLNGKSNISGEA